MVWVVGLPYSPVAMWIISMLLSVFVMSVMSQWPHHVYREDWKERTCNRILRQVTHRHVAVEMPPRLDGTWTSHRCEIRSGPQFVLRSYKFEGSRFESHLYHYADPDCSKPTYALVATGTHHILQESWSIPGTVKASYRMDDVHLVPYTRNSATRLLSHLAAVCNVFRDTILTPFRAYPVLKNFWAASGDSAVDDFDCTSGLNYTLNELQLVRLEGRTHYRGWSARHFSPSASTNRITDAASVGNAGYRAGVSGSGALRELLLGDVHSELSQRQRHRPSSFQEPLRDVKRSTCGVCTRISQSHELDPPRLGVHQGTLVSLEGKWVSTRCESRQYGQFLTRWLHFLSDGQSWEGRYDYYHDALCHQPTFTLRAKGSYAGGQESKIIRGSKMYSFKTTRLKVIPHDAGIVDTLNTYKGGECGRAGAWRRGHEQDVTGTGGCVTLGLRLPRLEHDLMRMEAGHRRLVLLVSQRTTDHPVRAPTDSPPAAFQAPLVKCDARDLDMSINSLPDEPHTRPHPLARMASDRLEAPVYGLQTYSESSAPASRSVMAICLTMGLTLVSSLML